MSTFPKIQVENIQIVAITEVPQLESLRQLYKVSGSRFQEVLLDEWHDRSAFCFHTNQNCVRQRHFALNDCNLSEVAILVFAK